MISVRLRGGTLLLSTLILVVIIGGSCGITAYLTQRTLNQELEEAARSKAVLLMDAIYNNIAATTQGDHMRQLIRMTELTKSNTELKQLVIFSEDGTIRQSINPADVGKKISEVHYQVYMNYDLRGRAYERAYNAGSERQFCMVKPLFNQVRCHGCHDKGKRVLGILDVCLNMNDAKLRMARNSAIVYRAWTISGAATGILAAAAIAVLIAIMGKRSVPAKTPEHTTLQRAFSADDLSMNSHDRSNPPIPLYQREEKGDSPDSTIMMPNEASRQEKRYAVKKSGLPRKTGGMLLNSFHEKIAALIVLILALCIGGSSFQILQRQSRQFVEITKDKAQVLTHAIVKSIQHDLRGACTQSIQGTFERIGVLPDIESLRIFDENGKVTKSADKKEVGLTIEDIGLEISKAGIPSLPYRGGHGYNAFCMVESIRNEENCRGCHPTKTTIGIFELCLSMKKTDRMLAANRRFLTYSSLLPISLACLAFAFFAKLSRSHPKIDPADEPPGDA